MINKVLKTLEIITSQFIHINSNIREYFIMALPLIFSFTIFNDVNILVIITEKVNITTGNYFLTALFGIVSLYLLFYYLKYPINLHRFAILQEKSNYFGIKKFKFTLIYWVNFLIIVIFCIAIILTFLLIDLLKIIETSAPLRNSNGEKRTITKTSAPSLFPSTTPIL